MEKVVVKKNSPVKNWQGETETLWKLWDAVEDNDLRALKKVLRIGVLGGGRGLVNATGLDN